MLLHNPPTLSPSSPLNSSLRSSSSIALSTSNNKSGQKSSPICARSKGRPSPRVSSILKSHGLGSGRSATNEVFCAAHLGGLCEEALEGLSEVGGVGRAVGYEGLVEKLSGGLMEGHFDVELTDKDR